VPRAPSVKRARPRACRSKYIGATVRVRGREATVVGCARPRKRPAPKAPLARFRVTYAKSGRTRPVPRKAVYRAARCSAKPTARGCEPFDIERAPWLARRAPNTSFDFGEDVPSPAAPPVRRLASRTQELQAPARLPSPPLLAVLQPETRELARWLAYAAPWAWRAVAAEVAQAHQIDAVTAQPLTREQRLARYGTNYGRGYGTHPEPNAPRRDLVGSGDAVARPDFAVRPSARAFADDAAKVAGAVLALESAVWSGALRRGADGLHSVALPAPAELRIPHGTHPSTAAAMRRRAAEANARIEQHLARLDAQFAQARTIVAGWSSGAKPIPDGVRALDRAGFGTRATQDDVEYAETWSHGGEDWRMTIAHETVDVRVERWTRAGWRFAWGAKFDTRRDTIPLEEAPADVADALRALLRNSGVAHHLPRLFGGGLAGRRRAALDRYDRGAAAPDPFAQDCAPPSAAREAWQLTRRLPCATPRAREALAAVRNRELAAICEDPFSEGCDAFHELVASGCEPACDPSKGGRDDGDCPAQITASQIERWSRGEDPVPDHVFDSDKPHLIGASDNCRYSASMRARMALHERVVADTAIPPQIERRGPSAVQAFLLDAIRRAEDADPRGEAWRRNDARILGRVKRAPGAGASDLDAVKHAYRALLQHSDVGPAYSLVKRGVIRADAVGEINEDTLVEALIEGWVEDQQAFSSEKGREARIRAFRNRVRTEGKASVAMGLAGMKRTRLGGAGTRVA
jgi:hypothetical protein